MRRALFNFVAAGSNDPRCQSECSGRRGIIFVSHFDEILKTPSPPKRLGGCPEAHKTRGDEAPGIQLKSRRRLPDFCAHLVEFVAATHYDALALNPPTTGKGANMTAAIRQFSLATTLVMCCTVARGADTYTVDPVHSSISFMISHIGISNIHGRFNDFSGKITIDKADPAKSSFALSIPIKSIDTNNVKRDEHLRAPDYFNVKQFPTMSFQSTSVKAVDGGYEVTGDLTLHGVTKPITFTLKGGDKVVEFPKRTMRIGLVSTLSIRRSEFGVTAALKSLGDEIPISIGLEAAK
jgi:polyisoprenoid-binding protein YceI